MEAVVTFKEFSRNCEINAEHRNDSDINAAYDDTEQEKGYITDERAFQGRHATWT
jgi:hypothetical protein